MSKKPVREKSVPPSPENTKDALIEAGKHLFAKHGFDGTTVKDISEKAGVNISLVSYHFQGKEGLYRACIEQYGSSRLEATQRLLQVAASAEEVRIRLSMFIEELMNWIQAEPEIHMIIQRKCDSGLPVAEDIFVATYMQIFETLHAFIAAAQKKKFLRTDIDSMIATRLLFGSLNSLMRSDNLSERFHGKSMCTSDYRNKVKNQAVTVFLDGLIDRKEK